MSTFKSDYNDDGSGGMRRSESVQLVMALGNMHPDFSPENIDKLSNLPTMNNSSEDASKNDDDEQVRKDVRRERNREHARISRERKRKKIELLTKDNETLKKDQAAALEECCRLRDTLTRSEHENARLRAWIEQARYAAQQAAQQAAQEDSGENEKFEEQKVHQETQAKDQFPPQKIDIPMNEYSDQDASNLIQHAKDNNTVFQKSQPQQEEEKYKQQEEQDDEMKAELKAVADFAAFYKAATTTATSSI
mmetsp:Transcript_17637/g.26517  ORF Transcript_17637/g.26517 Transcript_17637/m.26517 type:complete len:250 (-) Transcript_17637:126-875(-)